MGGGAYTRIWGGSSGKLVEDVGGRKIDVRSASTAVISGLREQLDYKIRLAPLSYAYNAQQFPCMASKGKCSGCTPNGYHYLDVQTKKASPSSELLNFRALRPTGDIIVLTWDAPIDTGGTDVEKYNISIYDTPELNPERTSTPSKMVVSSGLATQTEEAPKTYVVYVNTPYYRFYASAAAISEADCIGEGTSTPNITISTSRPSPPLEPTDVTVLTSSHTTGSCVQVQWVPPTQSGGSPVSGYKIFVEERGPCKPKAKVCPPGFPTPWELFADQTGNKSTTVRLCGLKSYRYYGFKVMALSFVDDPAEKCAHFEVIVRNNSKLVLFFFDWMEDVMMIEFWVKKFS
jgi:hypothetical protein